MAISTFFIHFAKQKGQGRFQVAQHLVTSALPPCEGAVHDLDPTVPAALHLYFTSHSTSFCAACNAGTLLDGIVLVPVRSPTQITKT